MEYVGIQTQIRRNNTRSFLMLLLFPVLISAILWLFYFLIFWIMSHDSNSGTYASVDVLGLSVDWLVRSIPWAFLFSGVWFAIAYFINVGMIKSATGARTLDRSENKRVYNLVENLCMAQGMPMPKIDVIEDGSLNAFASGIDTKTFTVTVTRGLIEVLDDDELEGVIAHELSHIRNRDVRLLIISIIFVGLFSMISQVMMMLLRTRGNGKKNAALILIGLLVALLGLLLGSLMRFGISRKREFMADAGAAEMTRKPLALASALRKISENPHVEVSNANVAQLFIENSREGSSWKTLFASHPPIRKRIEVLEQF